MRELAFAGPIALVFGLGSYYATGHLGLFSVANLALGALFLLIALVRGAGRARLVGGPRSRRIVARGLAWIAAALVVAVGIERAAARSGIQFDWTFERRFELSPAVQGLLGEVCERADGRLRASLFHAEMDPRTRRTRLLLEQLEEASPCPLAVRERLLEEHPEEEDRYAVGTSNTVVLELGERFETVERPTEGALFEALHRLLSTESGTLVLLRGEGQGDPMRDRGIDYSGLAVALQTEGYRLMSLATAAIERIPEEADAVVLIAPQRRMLESSLAVLRRYLEGGGSLVVLLEPGAESGVEEILADYGIGTPPAVIRDPASGALEPGDEGVDVIAYNYEVHPATRGLDRNRMTYFRGVRPLVLRKPRPEDEVERLVLSSPYAWLARGSDALSRPPEREAPPGAQRDYHSIAAAGRYPRDDHETRIFAVGDADFASNRYLRALYNLDLVMNGVHWAVAREPAITLRPKIGAAVQFPLPVTNTLRELYGVGLLVPELLLLAGGLVWLRRRSA